MSIIIIVASVFLLLGIVQLFINFNVSLLVTIILTVIVGALYIYTDRQCKQQESNENVLAEEIPEDKQEGQDNEQGQTTQNP